VASNAVGKIFNRTVTATATATARIIKQAGKVIAASAVGSLFLSLIATIVPFVSGTPYTGGGGLGRGGETRWKSRKREWK